MLEIFKILIWPLAAVIIALIFRNRIVNIIQRIKSLKGEKFAFEIDSIVSGLVLEKGKARQGGETMEAPDTNTLKAIVGNLKSGVCWYLLKATDKELDFMGHVEILAAEITSDIWNQVNLQMLTATGYLFCLMNYKDILFTMEEKEGKYILEISPEVISLIRKELKI
jgi:hypothetical protein